MSTLSTGPATGAQEKESPSPSYCASSLSWADKGELPWPWWPWPVKANLRVADDRSPITGFTFRDLGGEIRCNLASQESTEAAGETQHGGEGTCQAESRLLPHDPEGPSAH